MNSYKKLSRALLLIFLSISLFSTVSNAQSNSSSTRVIAIDEGHGQFINSTLLTGAISYLTDQGFKVIELNSSISLQNLNGVDLLLIPNPSRTATFTDNEFYSISKWMSNQNDRGMMLLSNPLDTQNSSLNGAGNVLNTIMASNYFKAGQQFLLTGSSPANDVVVERYQNSSVASPKLLIDVNSSVALPGNFSKQIETTSTALSINNESQTIVYAGYGAFSLSSEQTYSFQDTNLKLFAGFNYKSGRVVLGGSTTMFSDLNNPYESNKTWINSAYNKEFLNSIINWAINVQTLTISKEVSSDFFISLMLSIGAIGAVLVVIGTFLYSTGKDMKIFEIDQNFLRSQSADGNQDDKSGLTKSQKRLQQRMKNK